MGSNCGESKQESLGTGESFACAQQPLVSVIIVNWNGRHWLEQCLPTLASQTFQAFEVVVVDNGSTDGSVTWLTEQWPQVRVLSHSQNLGFARANNIAIQNTHAPYIVTLNNDTRLDPGWLAALVTAVSAPPIGMVASQIRLWQKPDVLDSAGIEVDWAGIAWNRGWGQPAQSAVKSCYVFGPSAAAALYCRAMLNDIGLFDEDFFAYYEDVDLAWRAQRAGWRCRYIPAACVWHWHSATTQRTAGLKAFLLGRNKMWTILKNYEWPSLLWAFPLILLYDVAGLCYQVIHSRSLAALSGRLSALTAVRRMLAKRTPVRTPAKLVAVRLPWHRLSN